MTIAKFGAALFAATLPLAGIAASAHAASPRTEMFLDNLSPNVDFLDQSSRFALQNSKSGKVHDFARAQAREQTLAANALDEWREARKAATPADAALQSGRSAAVDGQVAEVDQRLPMGKEDLDSLEGLEGPAFDAEYRAKQRAALVQIEADYQDYIARGDDPALLALASRELPKVRQRLVALGRI